MGRSTPQDLATIAAICSRNIKMKIQSETILKPLFSIHSLASKSRWFFISVFAMFTMLVPMISDANDAPRISTNQTWIENLQKGNDLKINNVDDAFNFIFSRLPNHVLVYPTENYYYFTFPSYGAIYAGNLRLAAQDRDKGIIHFAAFKQANQANEAGKMMYKALTTKDGVAVDKLSPFSYRVTYNDKQVTFQLNDVSAVKPTKDIIADGEEYLGLVVDESGVQFFLFYNKIHKVFAYVLDETINILDQFSSAEGNGRTLIGHRTGFAFYDHHYLNRRVLIGVHGANTMVNNYYDGPADQLPENHIKDDNLRKSIIDFDPSLIGELDKFGYFKSGEGRYLISPYIQYLSVDELASYDQCANNSSITPETYDACFFARYE